MATCGTASPIITRAWAMPSPDTFTIKPIAALLDRWLVGRAVIVDPFARNATRGTITNDINPDTSAQHHLDALEFARMLLERGTVADCVLFDPPYSMHQLKVSYGGSKSCSDKGTYWSNSDYFRRLKDELAKLLPPGGIVISCGWNSGGFGKGRGFDLREILLCAHGGARHDTITVVERKT